MKNGKNFNKTLTCNFFIFILCFSIVSLGCSKKQEDTHPEATATLAAKWSIQSFTIVGYNSQNQVIYTHTVPVDAGSYTQYNADSTYQQSDGSRVYQTGTYTYSGSTLTMTYYASSVPTTVQLIVAELTSKRLQYSGKSTSSTGYEIATVVLTR